MRRVIEISSSPARLSITNRQLVIDRPGHEPVRVPAEDIGMLIVDNPGVTYTHGVFTSLAEAGAAVVLCDARHLPGSVLLPVAGHTTQTERQRSQLDSSKPLKKRIWQTLVTAKLTMQGRMLEHAAGGDHGLYAMARRVRSGDPDNLEAKGAQRYFRRLFGRDFTRRRDGPPPNDLLNYGYMVVRAAVARSLVGSGLLPSLGVQHHNRSNPFCLADDLIEPFRPLVDLKVFELLCHRGGPEPLDREVKAILLSVFNETVPLTNGRRTPVSLAIQHSSATLAQSFLSGEVALVLPDGLPSTETADENPEQNFGQTFGRDPEAAAIPQDAAPDS